MSELGRILLELCIFQFLDLVLLRELLHLTFKPVQSTRVSHLRVVSVTTLQFRKSFSLLDQTFPMCHQTGSGRENLEFFYGRCSEKLNVLLSAAGAKGFFLKNFYFFVK